MAKSFARFALHDKATLTGTQNEKAFRQGERRGAHCVLLAFAGFFGRRVVWYHAQMDWKLFASTFVAIFAAELGDKTQLATLSLAAGGSSRWTVFAAAALALTATTALAVALGEALTRIVPPAWIRRGAGALFIVLGILFLVSPDEGTKPS